MTLHVKGGRTMWRGPGPKISVYENYYGREGNALFEIDNGEFTLRPENGNEFDIRSRHENGTDVEHDAAYLITLGGSGAVFKGVYGPRLEFTGVLMEGRWYDEDYKIEPGAKTPREDDDCDIIEMCDSEHCEKPHLIMPYLPPERTPMRARSVVVVIDFRGAKNEE